MKLQRTPLILLLVALVFSGAVYFYESQISPQQETAKATNQKLFPFKEADVKSFTVKTAQQTVQLERSTSSPGAGSKPTSQWKLTAPEQTAANDASVAYLLNLLATENSSSSLTVPANQKGEFGLDQPTATVEVQLNNQQTHRLLLGKPNFNQSSLYALVDPAADSGQQITVRLVSNDFQYAVNRPLAEWKFKPEPTPKPSSTQGQGTPKPENNPSPSPSASP